VTGGVLARDDSRWVLHLDGRQHIEVRSRPELNLSPGFSIEARVRIADVSDGRPIVYKEGQYNLRVDWRSEGSKISFFVFLDGQWEPRVSAVVPDPAEWHHIVAVWTGTQSQLWINGELHATTRRGKLPEPNDSPVLIGCWGTRNAGLIGAVESVKIHRRALSVREILKTAYGLSEPSPQSAATPTRFEFQRGAAGWIAGRGAELSVDGGRARLVARKRRAMMMQPHLNAPIDARDYLSLKMAVDRGSRGELIFVTTEGAGRMPFPIVADGRTHTYVLEPWTWPGWGGRLLTLGLVPSEEEGSTARVDDLRITEGMEAEPELEIQRVFAESTLPRAQRPEPIVVRVRNTGGPAENVSVGLTPSGRAKRVGPASHRIASLGYLEQRDVAFSVVAPAEGIESVDVEARAESSGGGSADLRPLPTRRRDAVRFAAPAGASVRKAGYVPEPVPAKTGKYALWTHYCPLWKQGTHYGWRMIEPWPERKPVLGWYNEGDPEVADWHIKYWLEHGITGVVYCWYRTNLNGPVKQTLGHAIHDGLLKARYVDRIKFSIMWENGCGQGVGGVDDLMQNVLPFWIENYFSHPSYLRVEGKPLLYIWVPQNVTKHLGGSDKVRETFARMRAVCRAKGLGGLYLAGCVGGEDRGAIEAMAREGWDATSAYGAAWRQPPVVRTEGDFVGAPFEGFIDQQEEIWAFKSKLRLLPDATAAMMGWDSRPWKETPFFWSENTPEKFRRLCEKAKARMDSGATFGPLANTAIFCCYNEFGEGHYIEPTRGYGFSYLDAIRDVFGDGPKKHFDLAPQDVGLGPYDSWYQAARRTEPSANAPQPTAWSGKSLAAWNAMMGLEGAVVGDDGLAARTSSRDPAVVSPELKIRASRYKKVVVRMRTGRGGHVQLFWTTASAPTASEAASLSRPLAAGAEQTVVFDVGGSDLWSGCVTGLRLDPGDHEGVELAIREIRLDP
jgi:hypothetical protein